MDHDELFTVPTCPRARADEFAASAMISPMRWQPEREHRVMRWANGRGVTKEIAAFPNGESWRWRLSLADVAESGPFSLLTDVDRSLVVASGAGMRLTVGERAPVELRRFDTTEFPGDDASAADLVDGPIRDLNLMVRRDSGLGAPHLDVRHVAKGSEVELNGAVGLVVLDGVLTLTAPSEGFPYTPLRCRVGRFDAVLPGDDGENDARLVAAVESVVAFAFLRSDDGRPA